MSAPDLNDGLRRFFEANPDLADLMGLAVRSPRYRYWSAGQRRFCWTVEPLAGKYITFEYVPVGPGSRTGKAKQLKLGRRVENSTRRAAKARAARWLESYEDRRTR